MHIFGDDHVSCRSDVPGVGWCLAVPVSRANGYHDTKNHEMTAHEEEEKTDAAAVLEMQARCPEPPVIARAVATRRANSDQSFPNNFPTFKHHLEVGSTTCRVRIAEKYIGKS